MKPLIAVPHWRAPTSERTKYYYDALTAAGAGYIIVEGGELPGEARGLLLTGGVDVDPRLYGEKIGPHTDKPNPKRDKHERGLLEQALERGIAVLPDVQRAARAVRLILDWRARRQGLPELF